MGRLENIIARNRRPPRRFDRVPIYVGGLLLLVLLGLLIFTDLAEPPPDERYREKEPPRDRVDDVKLWRAPRQN